MWLEVAWLNKTVCALKFFCREFLFFGGGGVFDFVLIL